MSVAFDKVVKVKLLLQAGAANKNIQLRTIFNNHRSTFYDSFVEKFNQQTTNLPNDVLVVTIIYIPLPGSQASECKFIIKGPSLYSLFKKFNFLNIWYSTGLVYLKISLFDLYKISVLKSQFSDVLKGLHFSKLVNMFISSFYSYNINKKNLLFVIKYIEGSRYSFYSTHFFSRFYRTFFN